MKKIAIIGHSDHNKTTLTSAIKSVLDKEEYMVYQKDIERIYEFKNPYFNLDLKASASKSRLNKCKKGLHEFSEMNFSENNIPQWACIHCGTFINNR